MRHGSIDGTFNEAAVASFYRSLLSACVAGPAEMSPATKSYSEGCRETDWTIASLPESGYGPADRKAGNIQEKRRKLTTEEFEAFYGSKDMGTFVRVICPWYFWWMRREFAEAKTPQYIALIHATPRARTFWAVCGIVCFIPVVLVIMFLMTR